MVRVQQSYGRIMKVLKPALAGGHSSMRGMFMTGLGAVTTVLHRLGILGHPVLMTETIIVTSSPVRQTMVEKNSK